MISIVDSGIGNVASLLKMFAKLRIEAQLVRTAAEVAQARKLILPGVGHFAAAMEELRRRDLVGVLNDKVLGERIPTLGVCLGMQLLTRGSEEGGVEGLGWIDADTVRFAFPASGPQEKIPNMGWRPIVPCQPTPLFPDIGKPWRFYFVHSYHVICRNPVNELARSRYGIDYTACVVSGNIYGMQFHPEKSHRYGMQALGAFAELL